MAGFPVPVSSDGRQRPAAAQLYQQRDQWGSRAWALPLTAPWGPSSVGTVVAPNGSLTRQPMLLPTSDLATSQPRVSYSYVSIKPSGLTVPRTPVQIVDLDEGEESSASISSQQEPRLKHAKSQKVDGIEIWPEYWGITREQCMELWHDLLDESQSGTWDPANTVYHLVQDKIKPWTKGLGYGYALLKNKDDPKETNCMVSHAWNENALEFLEAICRSTTESDVLFICAFSLYQCEDGAGPSISEQLGENPDESPFQRVLEHIAHNGEKTKVTDFFYRRRPTLFYVCDLIGIAALCVLYAPAVLDGVVYTLSRSARKQEVCPSGSVEHGCEPNMYSWVWGQIWPGFRLCWPLFIVLLVLWAAMRITLDFLPATTFYRGRMIVVPNRNADLYSRLWCVYEIFIARKLAVPCELGHTMARLGLSSVRQATCASPVDEHRIQQEIESMNAESDVGDGYDQIDESITKLTKELDFAVFRLVCILGFPNIIVGLAYYNLYDPEDCRQEFWGDTLGLILVIIGLVIAYYKVFKHGQGNAAARDLCVLALAQLSLGIVFEILRRVSIHRKAVCKAATLLMRQSSMEFFWAFLFGFSKAARMGLLSMCVFSFVGLVYTYFNRRPRALYRSPLHLFGFSLVGVAYVALRTTVLGKKHIAGEEWTDLSQALPEIFAIVTEFMAGIGCPLNSIWKASLYWGLTVDWDNFGKRKGAFDIPTDSDESRALTEGALEEADE